MSRATFYTVDVFAEKRYAGNQLAVFRHADDISDGEIQQIARETNFSETTFITAEKPTNGGYAVRIFTPGEEVPFAGHPTLGTAFVIQQEIVGKPVEQIVLNLKIGSIPVTFSYVNNQPNIMWMRQQQPLFGEVIDPAAVAAAIGLTEDDIDLRFPIQEVSTGMPAMIVPLKGLRALQKARVERRMYLELVNQTTAKNIFVFCPESHDGLGDFSVRCFAEFYGITEDPATGSANGCFAAYLTKHRYTGNDSIDVRVEQGYEIGRSSLLYLRASAAGGTYEIMVGGKAVMVSKGEWL